MAEVARSCQVDPNVLRRWRRDFVKAPESAFPGPGRTPEDRRIAELRQQINRQAQEIDTLKQFIQRIEKATSAAPLSNPAAAL